MQEHSQSRQGSAKVEQVAHVVDPMCPRVQIAKEVDHGDETQHWSCHQDALPRLAHNASIPQCGGEGCQQDRQVAVEGGQEEEAVKLVAVGPIDGLLGLGGGKECEPRDGSEDGASN